MRSRQEIKAIGKAQFMANYWPCVGAVVLVGLVAGVACMFSPIALFIIIPIEIGMNYFFIMNILGRANQVSATTPFSEGFNNYGRRLGGYLWMLLFTFLWSMLFWIPGIIKAYSYSMTPYILADCPNVKAKDALKLSMRMMAGHKWELFVFQLSFIGWALLSCLTFGLLNIFFLDPYMNSASACWYLEVRESALRTGAITMAQLEGRQEVD